MLSGLWSELEWLSEPEIPSEEETSTELEPLSESEMPSVTDRSFPNVLEEGIVELRAAEDWSSPAKQNFPEASKN